MTANIPITEKKRIVIIGGGFAGFTLARRLNDKYYQVVLLDRFNYHQFQPLLYQVATAGLEPSAISFPFRKIFQAKKDCHFRLCEVLKINSEQSCVETSVGIIKYDYLVIASGCMTNYFGLENIRASAMPMKSVSEALGLRNLLLETFEKALCTVDLEERQAILNIVVVGGGPTGVEVSGALAEMKNYILPKDYKGVDFSKMQVYLIEAAPALLAAMSKKASAKSLHFLQKMGVQVLLNTPVKDYIEGKVVFADGTNIATQTVIWASGMIATAPEGLDTPGIIGRGKRLIVDSFSRVTSMENIFAIGDVCLQTEAAYPNGHPQLAQVAMQQARNLAKNFKHMQSGKSKSAFHYRDKGSMATIGRNKAVVDLPFFSFQGFFAWIVWMVVHLMLILGVKNKLLTVMDWMWSYLKYNPSLRLIIRPTEKSRLF